MSLIDDMKIRLNYAGGAVAESRFQNDKLRTLKKALLYSYQAATAILEDGREFRCLINPDNLKGDQDNKIISIPFEDICLNKEKNDKTSKGIEEIGLSTGDTFEWKETNTHWLVQLRYLEEDSYFRAQIRRCDQEIEINDNKYWVQIRGPVETDIPWNQKNNIIFNTINYSNVMYITKNEETEQFFHRFTKIKVNGKMWEVQVVNDYYGDNIIEVYLNEYYNNSILDKVEETKQEKINDTEIEGKIQIYPYAIETYTVQNFDEGGQWQVDSDKVIISEQSPSSAIIKVLSGKQCNFILSQTKEDNTKIDLPIEVLPF